MQRIIHTRLRVPLTLYDRAQVLTGFPEMGHRYWASSRHYRITYLIKDEKNIDIPGVFHGSLDISKYQL
ncbi:MAG: hypothetical protein ACREQO_17530 [Candidatus Binatia bacterium]